MCRSSPASAYLAPDALFGRRFGTKRQLAHLDMSAAIVRYATHELGDAERTAADLVVVGAYSHARTAEMIFGGVTRSLLRDAAVPLLIAH
jgi:nucleotide-binding universal stress UspA family protein